MRRPNDFKDGIVQESQEILLASCSKLGLEVRFPLQNV